MSFANSEFHSFLLGAFYFSCLTALTRTSNTVLNKSDECRHSCLVPDIRRQLLAFIIGYDINYELIIRGFYYVEVNFLYTHLFLFFNHKCMLKFSRGILNFVL